MKISLHLMRKVDDKFVDQILLLSIPEKFSLSIVGRRTVSGLQPTLSKYIEFVNNDTRYTPFKRIQHLEEVNAHIKACEVAHPKGTWTWLAF